jgi:hypothetical protein
MRSSLGTGAASNQEASGKKNGRDIVVEVSLCSQKRMTRQPYWRKIPVAGRSRRASFTHKAWLFMGILVHFHHRSEILSLYGKMVIDNF